MEYKISDVVLVLFINFVWLLKKTTTFYFVALFTAVHSVVPTLALPRRRREKKKPNICARQAAKTSVAHQPRTFKNRNHSLCL